MAKFCKNCGTVLKQGVICQNCGTVNEKVKKELESNKSSDNKKEENNKNYTNTNQTNNGNTGIYQNQQNSMALLGFVLSLVSLFCCGFCNILALIFSIIGYSQASRYSDSNNNKGLAIAGIVISSISLALVIFATIFGSIFSLGFFSNYYKR